jgi:hypothetical protein
MIIMLLKELEELLENSIEYVEYGVDLFANNLSYSKLEYANKKGMIR